MRPSCHRRFSPLYPLLLLAFLLLSALAHNRALAQPAARLYDRRTKQDTLIIHFAFDKFEIEASDTSHLTLFLRRASALTPAIHSSSAIDSIFITGYTDKTGTIAYNLHLSEERALAIAGELRRRQFIGDDSAFLMLPNDRGRWRISGRGIAPTTEQSDSANRRAEIIFSYAVSSPRAGDTAAAAPRATPPAAPASPVTQPATPPADSLAVIQQTDTPRAVIKLQKINFVVDTPIPTAATRTVLPGIVRLLQQYRDRRMEIDGYVNSFTPLHGKDDPLFVLSVNRAKFIYDYLIAAGFDPNKLTYKGMGNASPVNPNPTTKAEMNANMRVEIKVY